MGVLHTWGRDLSYHPHAHFLVPGGGIDASGHWQCSRASLFVPEQVLESLFRSKLKSLLDQAGLLDQVPGSVWRGRFVVDSKSVGTGAPALQYLAPYVSRGCVANWRVRQCNGAERLADARLVLQVKRSGSKQYKPMPLSVTEFIRRWLQHVVPSGFHRVRHYGFLSSHSRRSHEELELLIAAALGVLCYLFATPQIVCAEPMKMRCEYCGGCMISLGYFPPSSANQGRAPP